MNFSAPLAEEYKFGDISKEAAKRAKNAVANLLGQERWKGDSFSTHLPESDGKIYRLYRKTSGNLLFGAFELLKSWVSSDFPNKTGDFPQEEYKFGDVTKKAMNKAMDAIAGFTGKEDGALWTTRDTGPRTFEWNQCVNMVLIIKG